MTRSSTCNVYKNNNKIARLYAPAPGVAYSVYYHFPMARSRRRSAGVSRQKMHKVMGEFSHHTLHSGSKRGPVVTSRKQAIAIAYAEARRARARKRK